MNLQSPADRLSKGSTILVRRMGNCIVAWCRKGDRADLVGWRSALGPLVRLAVIGVVVVVIIRIVRSAPGLMWVIVLGWLIAAWRAGPVAAGEPEEEIPEDDDEPLTEPDAPDADAVRALLATLIGDRNGVHLSTVLAHLQERGLGEGWAVSDLRARLEALGIPVRDQVKVNGIPTRGVHRDDLTPPTDQAAEEPSTAPSTAA